jgi:hypothetical protein
MMAAAAVHPTPSAVHQCVGQGNTAATVCTMPPGCPPHTVHNTMCICPTPSAVHQCGGPAHPTLPPACAPTVNPPCFTITFSGCFTLAGCITMGACSTVAACTPITIQNGVFTPFGR